MREEVSAVISLHRPRWLTRYAALEPFGDLA